MKAKRRPRRAIGSVPICLDDGDLELLDAPPFGIGADARVTGGDIDADWRRAACEGEEGVGGSAPTPDQDEVDEIGRALGVEQELDAEVRTSGEILRHRDRRYWTFERRATRKRA